jgi:hypothetical protein
VLHENLSDWFTDPDGDALTVRLVSGPSGGALTLGADGRFTYSPDLLAGGIDGFAFIVSDGELDSAVTFVTLQRTRVAARGYFIREFWKVGIAEPAICAPAPDQRAARPEAGGLRAVVDGVQFVATGEFRVKLQASLSGLETIQEIAACSLRTGEVLDAAALSARIEADRISIFGRDLSAGIWEVRIRWTQANGENVEQVFTLIVGAPAN